MEWLEGGPLECLLPLVLMVAVVAIILYVERAKMKASVPEPSERSDGAPRASEEHLAMLSKGVKAWNRWRAQNPDIKPNLIRADLSKADLRKVDFSNTDLTDADLTFTDLRGANLKGANFSGAETRGTKMDVSGSR